MKHLLTLLIFALVASTSFAQEAATKEKKGSAKNSQVKRMKKLLTPVTMTSEQETSFGEAAEKLKTDLAAVEENGLTKELLKMHEEKKKAARKSGLKGKELQASLMEGLTAEQVELFKSFDSTIRSFEKTVASMLTDEQMSALPEKAQKKMKKAMREKGSKGRKSGKGKKKKKAATE